MNISLLLNFRNPLWSISRVTLCDMSKMQAFQQCSRSSSSSQGSSGGNIPKNAIGHIYSAASQTGNGRVYDRKPFKMRLLPNKNYMWCLCGHSKSQPICDGSHKWPELKCTLKPVKFQVEEERDYWLCNCKQSKLRPFCDGTHKNL